MAALTDQSPTADLRIEEPVIGGERPGLDSIKESESSPVRAQRFAGDAHRRSESSVEPHHQPRLGRASGGRDPIQLLGLQSQWFLDEHSLVGEKSSLDVPRVGIVAGPDEYDFGAMRFDGGTRIGAATLKASAASS